MDRENVLFFKKDVVNGKLTANINVNLVEIPPALLGALPLFQVMETLTPKVEKVEKVVDGLPDGTPTILVAVVGTNKNDKITPARRNDSQPLQCKLCSHPDWWIQHASPFVVRLIKRGVEADLWVADRQACRQHHTAEEIARAMQVLREYAALGACVRLSRDVGYCVPWFLIQQTTHGDAGYRFIMDMTWINGFIRAPKFRLDSIGQEFSHIAAWHVSGIHRFVQGLFSFAVACRASAVRCGQCWWRVLAVVGFAVWFGAFTFFVGWCYADDRTIGSKKWLYDICVLG